MIRKAPLLLSFLFLWGCQSLNQSNQSSINATDPKTQMAALEGRIAILVEEERRKLNPKAASLILDPELSAIARARAADMASKNYLAHIGPDGESAASLLMKQNANWQGLLGENLAAQHYSQQIGLEVDAFAHRFLDEWVKSPPHRENLIYSSYDRAGVGAAVNADTIYVALLFSKELSKDASHKRPTP